MNVGDNVRVMLEPTWHGVIQVVTFDSENKTHYIVKLDSDCATGNNKKFRVFHDWELQYRI